MSKICCKCKKEKLIEEFLTKLSREVAKCNHCREISNKSKSNTCKKDVITLQSEAIYECYCNHMTNNGLCCVGINDFHKDILCCSPIDFNKNMSLKWKHYTNKHYGKWKQNDYKLTFFETIKPYHLFEANEYKTIFHHSNIQPHTPPREWGNPEEMFWSDNIIFKEYNEIYPNTHYEMVYKNKTINVYE